MHYIMEETEYNWAAEHIFPRLPRKEQEFLQKRRNEKAFAEGLLARGLLLYGLKKEHNLNVLPEIVRDENGKPYFRDCPDISFNLSHTSGWIMAALSSTSVGVDIQTRIPYRETLLRGIVHENERALLVSEKSSSVRNGIPEAYAIPSLTPLWCLKEAFLKYTGEGIRRPLRELDFSSVLLRETDRYEGVFCRFFQNESYSFAVIQETWPEDTVYINRKDLENFL